MTLDSFVPTHTERDSGNTEWFYVTGFHDPSFRDHDRGYFISTCECERCLPTQVPQRLFLRFGHFSLLAVLGLSGDFTGRLSSSDRKSFFQYDTSLVRVDLFLTE